MTNTANQRQGCLAAILHLYGVGKPQPAHTSTPPPSQPVHTLAFPSPVKTPTAIPVETLPYRTRDDFLAPTELSFYRVLASVLTTVS
jgi:hypothetical protein